MAVYHPAIPTPAIGASAADSEFTSNPFSKSRASISVTDTHRGKAAMEPTYLQLDFGKLRDGNCDLIVRVTDKIANITKENKLQLELE